MSAWVAWLGPRLPLLDTMIFLGIVALDYSTAYSPEPRAEAQNQPLPSAPTLKSSGLIWVRDYAEGGGGWAQQASRMVESCSLAESHPVLCKPQILSQEGRPLIDTTDNPLEEDVPSTRREFTSQTHYPSSSELGAGHLPRSFLDPRPLV